MVSKGEKLNHCEVITSAPLWMISLGEQTVNSNGGVTSVLKTLARK